MEDNKLITTSIVNIREVLIGDRVCQKGHDTPMFVVATFADAGTLGMPEDHTGSVYCDFPDNPGDVFEFTIDEIDKILDK